MKLIFGIIVFLSAFHVSAKCKKFEFKNEYGNIPYIVHGKVVRSNEVKIKNPSCFTKGKCHHEFEVEVLESLKGQILAGAKISFKYNYYFSKPGVDSFSLNKEYIFAIKSFEDGNGILYGTKCGWWGAPSGRLKDIKGFK